MPTEKKVTANVPLPADLHREMRFEAIKRGITLPALIVERCRAASGVLDTVTEADTRTPKNQLKEQVA